MQQIINMIWDKLQFGFDIVIPVVAIWIFVKWVRESRVRSIDVTLKSALLDYLLSLIHSLSEKFVKNLVESCLEYEKNVDSLIKKAKNSEGSIDWDVLVSLVSDEFIDEELGRAKSARLVIDDFYNTVQSYRYSIYPLLRTLGAGAFIGQFEAEMDDILSMHNEILKSMSVVEMKLAEGNKKDAVKFMALLSEEFQKARIECKEVCSFLSALLDQVLTQDHGTVFEKTILDYKKLLKCEETIR